MRQRSANLLKDHPWTDVRYLLAPAFAAAVEVGDFRMTVEWLAKKKLMIFNVS